MKRTRSVVCERCGATARPSDVEIRHSRSDPLQVAECARCGSIVRIGGHDW